MFQQLPGRVRTTAVSSGPTASSAAAADVAVDRYQNAHGQPADRGSGERPGTVAT